MDRPDGDGSVSEILGQLRPALEQIFAALGVPPGRAAAIVEESCRVLIAKRMRRENPAAWLLHDIIERCARSTEP